ncbi:MAG: hypothetical protein HC887_01455 [Desulfobacteraceae bacterium]|nr:hypothetical protein [Desulfobacteraceae bacterium]
MEFLSIRLCGYRTDQSQKRRGTRIQPNGFFKKNAVSTRISEDPGVLRENRLGTLMLRYQIIREKGSLTVAAAPEVSDSKEQWWTDRGSAGLALDRTNSDNRFLAKLTLNIRKDFSPELLYYYEEGANPTFGLNITEGIGDNIISYLEWSGGKRKKLISAALQEAVSVGLFPADMPAVLSADDKEQFTNQLAVGISYTEKLSIVLLIWNIITIRLAFQKKIGISGFRPVYLLQRCWTIRSGLGRQRLNWGSCGLSANGQGKRRIL